MHLLERTPFLDTLESVLCQVADGRGQIAVVGGEASIGKTALLLNSTPLSKPSNRSEMSSCG